MAVTSPLGMDFVRIPHINLPFLHRFHCVETGFLPVMIPIRERPLKMSSEGPHSMLNPATDEYDPYSNFNLAPLASWPTGQHLALVQDPWLLSGDWIQL